MVHVPVYCNSWVFIGLQAMIYGLIYHGPQKRLVYMLARTVEEHQYCNSLGAFNKTIIRLMPVGYEKVMQI